MNVIVKFELDAEKLPQDIDRNLKQQVATACGIKLPELLHYRILKRSLDARKKPKVKILYQVLAGIAPGAAPKRPTEPWTPGKHWRIPESGKVPANPIVVGTGPSGLFAALVLAEAGLRPIILERGKNVEERRQDIDSFFETGRLNPESNLLYGEGGAGTWSDGKLFTRVRDERGMFVMEEFVEAGADPNILYLAHPHIGSDKLPGVISNLRKRIEELGGTFRWNSRVLDIYSTGVLLENGEKLDAPAVFVACGHSARPLILALTEKLQYSMKGFQIGCRIEHPQKFINLMQFGAVDSYPALGAAEYIFSLRNSETLPGATTFCMCPGGEIIPAVCEDGRLSTNGMSESARAGRFANSAVVTTLDASRFASPREAFAFLNGLEEKFYHAGGGGYVCPAQNAADFVAGKSGRLPKDRSSYRLGLHQARLDELFPSDIADTLSRAVVYFDRLAHGFLRYGLFHGIETRVSSPVRFERNPETLESSMPGIYVLGEGGGAAGGIVSAAIDGVRAAEAYLIHSR